MDITIPRRSSSSAITRVPSRELVKRILRKASCKILKKREKKGKPIEIEAQKIVRKGRIHIRARYPKNIGHYLIHLHFDKRKLLTNHISLDDCDEVRTFANKYVIPEILRHRKLYRFRVKMKDKWRVGTTLLPGV